MNTDLELKIITESVEQERVRCNITPKYAEHFEFSCEAFGEGANLYRQLLLTVKGCGYWETIKKDSELRQLVLEYIRRNEEI